MKELIFNDGRKIEVQSVTKKDGILHVRMILTTSETIKALFADNFATSVMTLRENGKQQQFENYTVFKYVKEETGGIWEVEMRQTEADLETRMAEVEEKTAENNMNLELAIAELTMAIASLIPARVEEEVQ